MRMPTGAWRRLYSLILISRVTFSTSAAKPCGHDVSMDWSSSM
jgi:hypothetical protein